MPVPGGKLPDKCGATAHDYVPISVMLPATTHLTYLCIMQDLSQARFTLSGTVQALSGTESASVKDVFRKRHPNSFWIDFGDFTMFRMQPLIARFNFGFASAGTVGHCMYVWHLHKCCAVSFL